MIEFVGGIVVGMTAIMIVAVLAGGPSQKSREEQREFMRRMLDHYDRAEDRLDLFAQNTGRIAEVLERKCP